MSDAPMRRSDSPLGIIGFGAFGQLMAEHLRACFTIYAHDIAPDPARAEALGATIVPFEIAATCPMVVLAVPVGEMRGVAARLAPHLKPGALVLDVGSVKVEPAAILLDALPDHVEIVATHPLFGPMSARAGLRGARIAICPLRGRRFRVAAFCRRLGLDVILTTPEQHDRDAAEVQGLTHLVASLLTRMDLHPTRLTTRSFELMMSAVDMVRNDAPEVRRAILAANPYAGEVLRRFKSLTSTLDDPGV
ncbi:prephenate dehydrogenase [Pleomorphomonas sp. JP5]|uniref:prephenate dehydrogenase n=1 Tax=Pleomorphomonas sp. JP5 TaxID=2942998 RepID=UPI002044B2DB|nr:prephenate dehydrogenase [Pleomorphomonas sp. JP5]MCM5557567.1 prephenate dehydrogenase [Pleomorphomonas sp. JP5]